MICRKTAAILFIFPFGLFGQTNTVINYSSVDSTLNSSSKNLNDTGIFKTEMQDTVFASEDSPIVKTKTDTLLSDIDYLEGGSYMLQNNFQLRIVSNFNTQREFYKSDMIRIDSDTRNSAFTCLIQGWFRVNERINVGLFTNIRSINTGSYSSSSLDVLRFESDKNSKTVFRTVSPAFKILLYSRKFRLTYQSTLFIPLSETINLSYKNNSFRDVNNTQLTQQLSFAKKYSKYFSLYMQLNSILRFGNTNRTNSFTVRLPVTPVFNYYFSPYVRFYALAEFNPLLIEEPFSTFFFREGAGFTIQTNSTLTFDLQYSYVVLGKNAVAAHNIIFAARISF